jgi:uncharacterized membrane protein SirB2
MNMLQITLLTHLGAVGVSAILLAVRFALVTATPDPLPRVLRIVPGIVDLVLVLSAVTLCIVLGLYPLQQPWLTAKALGLLVYMGCAHPAVAPGKPVGRRVLLLVIALLALVYNVAVALRADPTPW